MDLFKSVFSGGSGSKGTSGGSSSSAAETIERLVNRINSSTLLEDRRDALRAVKAMSRKYRVEVGVQALDPVVAILETDRDDEEIVGYALETLANICSPDEFDEEEADDGLGASGSNEKTDKNTVNLGEQFTEIYLKNYSNVQRVVDVLEDYDFRIRRPAIRLLTYLLINKPRVIQEVILASHMGVSRLMDVLVDSREVLRNDALILLIQLTKGNANLQKIVAFENAFDKLVDIIELEDYADGGIVVEDCLRLMLNLLRNNSSNQTFFREGSYIQRISPFFDLNLDQEEMEVGWPAQKVSNMLHMLQVVRTLVSPSNPTQVTVSCQSTIQQCGLLSRLCEILMASGIPADILTETINALSESIRGHPTNQMMFSQVNAPSVPPRSALVLLLMSMVNEKQPFSLRCAVLYCFQCYIHKNPSGQKDVMRTLLRSPEDESEGSTGETISTGQLLCGGLFSSNDKLSNWFSSVALAHGLMNSDEVKKELLRVKLSTSKSNNPVSLLHQCFDIVVNSNSQVQTRLGLLMLLCTWITDCNEAVASLLSSGQAVQYLTGQIGSNEHDEVERLTQGLCSFLLGLCVLFNDQGQSREELMQLIEKRIGTEIFLDKLAEVSKHEGYNRALKQPQLKVHDASELIFDYKFCQDFKMLEHKVLVQIQNCRSDQGTKEDEHDPAVVLQYKDLIREQDSRINEISRANIYLQQELANAKQELEEANSLVQSLQDRNALLKALQPTDQEPDGNSEQELKECRDQIRQLELQLQHSKMNGHHEEARSSSNQAALEAALQEKEIRIASLETAQKESTEAMEQEQEDLLIMLSDQDAKLKKYRKLLRSLDQPVSPAESDED